MPYKVVKHGSKWQIVRKDTGEVVGESDTKGKAMVSMSIRERAHREKMMK